MATFFVNGKLIPATTSFTVRTSLSRNREFLPPSSFRLPRTISTPSPRVPDLKCSANFPNRGIEPFLKVSRLNSVAKPLVLLCVASAVAVHLLRGLGLPSFLNGGGRDGNDGGFWRKLFSSPAPEVDDKEQSSDWDSHGLAENITVQLKELSRWKKYKISEITFFDETTQTTSGTEDILYMILPIRSGRVYTKAELKKQMDMLSLSIMFKKIDFKLKSKPDGTLGVTILLEENTWPSPEMFRFMNVRLIMKAYTLQRELMKMVRDEGRLTGRLLLRIRLRILKWYHDQGYIGAHLVNFMNLNTQMLEVEVTEGKIFEIVFLDEHRNVIQDSPKLSLVRNILPKQVYV